MKFVSDLRPELPKLAWLAVIEADDPAVRLMHGAYVEVRSHFFVEGVWDGEFGGGGFSTTPNFFGSGGIISDEEIRFVSSGSTTDYLYYGRRGRGGFVASNSLPLLLAHTGDRLKPSFDGYTAINRSVALGPSRYMPDIPTQMGKVRRLVYRNLAIRAGRPAEYDKATVPGFPTFEDYKAYLVGCYGKIVANARDVSRRRPLAILTTQSRGYDTTAINAIAAPFGVDLAFTVTRGKPAGTFANAERDDGDSDDGTEICSLLGIPCKPIDRRAFVRDSTDEHLYYATLEENQDLNLKEVMTAVPGAALLLTGTLGELWYPRTSYSPYVPNRDDPFQRGDLGTHGLTEARLVGGLIHVPVPYIGAQRRADVVAITESAAMNEWRLRTSYDRPIPRRLAEEAGISRTLFGQKKIGSVVEFAPPHVPYGDRLRAEYFQFLVVNRIARPWQLKLLPVVRRVNEVLWFAGERRYRAVYYAQRIVSKATNSEYHFSRWWRGLDGRLFCFSANRRADELARLVVQVDSVTAPPSHAIVSSAGTGPSTE